MQRGECIWHSYATSLKANVRDVYNALNNDDGEQAQWDLTKRLICEMCMQHLTIMMENRSSGKEKEPTSHDQSSHFINHVFQRRKRGLQEVYD